MPARDMTYLFVLIGLPVIKGGRWLERCGKSQSGNRCRTLPAGKGWGFHDEQSQRITDERIDLVKRGKYDLLLEDLR